MADDPYLTSGRKVLSGGDDTSSSSSAADDPYLASGRKALAAEPSSSGADLQQPPASTPYDVEHSWLGIPAIHNFAAGVTQGARDVVKSGLDLGAWVDKRVPVLSWLDEHNPLIGDPEKRAAEFEATRRAYEASPEGQSYTGGAGRLVGQIGTTAPLVGPVAEGVGAGVSALAALVPKVPTILPWAVRTATEGGVAGGIFGGLTEGGSDRPAGESIRQGAEWGAALGPPASAVAKGIGFVARGGVATGAISMTAADAKQAASSLYKTADATGGTLTPTFTNKFIDSVAAAAPQTEAGAAVSGQSAVSNLVERMQSLRDKPMTLQAAQEVDEALGNLIDKEYGMKGLSKEGKQLQDVQHAFRDQIEGAGPGDITGDSGGFGALSQARKAWSQAMKMDDLERMQARAAQTDNPTTSFRTQVRTLLNNRSRSRGYSEEEVAAVKDAADRGVIGGALHLLGSRLIPIIAGSVEAGARGILSGAGAATTTYLGGAAMRGLENQLAARRLSNAMTVLGRGVPPNPLHPPP